MLGRVAARRSARAWGIRLVLAAKKCLEAMRRDNQALMYLSLSFPNSVAQVLAFFFFLSSLPAGAGHWRIGGRAFWTLVWVYDCRAESEQAILSGAKLLRFLGLGEGLRYSSWLQNIFLSLGL